MIVFATDVGGHCHFDGCPLRVKVAVQVPNGCVCYPDHSGPMLLCLQHASGLEPL